MYSLADKISPQRLQNIKDAATEIQVRFRDWLKKGFYHVSIDQEGTINELCRRLVDMQSPGLAAMVSALGDINMSDWRGKEIMVTDVARVYMLASAIENFDNLSAEWKDEVLCMAGVWYPKQQVIDLPPISDNWMCLAITKEKYNSFTMTRTWITGSSTGRIGCIVEYHNGAHHVASMYEPGLWYKANVYYYPGVRSFRVLMGHSERVYGYLSPRAFGGVEKALSIYRRVIAENPFLTFVPLIVSGLQWAISGDKLMISGDGSFVVEVSNEQRDVMLAVSGGNEFSAFVLFGKYACKVVGVWTGGRYYFFNNGI
jgi:hypothetical protein